MKLLFTGDTGIIHQGIPAIDSRLKDAFSKADFRISNLEGPILKSEGFRAICKKGPGIRLSPSTLDFLKELQISHLSIANNHIIDYGISGLEETLSQTGDYTVFGAGSSFHEAYMPVCFKKDCLTVGTIAVAENGFGGAVSGTGGFAQWYPSRDFHKFFFGEILAVSGTEKYRSLS